MHGVHCLRCWGARTNYVNRKRAIIRIFRKVNAKYIHTADGRIFNHNCNHIVSCQHRTNIHEHATVYGGRSCARNYVVLTSLVCRVSCRVSEVCVCRCVCTVDVVHCRCSHTDGWLLEGATVCRCAARTHFAKHKRTHFICRRRRRRALLFLRAHARRASHSTATAANANCSHHSAAAVRSSAAQQQQHSILV